MANTAFFLFAVLLASIELGTCLKCYQCNSQRDKHCADEKFADPQFLVDCNTQRSKDFNRLYVQTAFPSIQHTEGSFMSCYKISVGALKSVIRTCLDANPSSLNQSCKLLSDAAASPLDDPSRRLITCDACDKDGCNAAGTVIASLPLALLTVVISYFVCKQ